jgi:hypothetical protein
MRGAVEEMARAMERRPRATAFIERTPRIAEGVLP